MTEESAEELEGSTDNDDSQSETHEKVANYPLQLINSLLPALREDIFSKEELDKFDALLESIDSQSDEKKWEVFVHLVAAIDGKRTKKIVEDNIIKHLNEEISKLVSENNELQNNIQKHELKEFTTQQKDSNTTILNLSLQGELTHKDNLLQIRTTEKESLLNSLAKQELQNIQLQNKLTELEKTRNTLPNTAILPKEDVQEDLLNEIIRLKNQLKEQEGYNRHSAVTS